MRKPRHTKRRDRVIRLMRRGDALCCQTHPDGTQWWLEPSGKTVGPITALKVIAFPGVVQQHDGLFDDMSQTFILEDDEPDSDELRVDPRC